MELSLFPFNAWTPAVQAGSGACGGKEAQNCQNTEPKKTRLKIQENIKDPLSWLSLEFQSENGA